MNPDYKYAIMAYYYMWDEELEREYQEWLYLGVDEKRIFVFDDEVNERTKLFDTATEAGQYLDSHFGKERTRCSFSKMKIVEV